MGLQNLADAAAALVAAGKGILAADESIETITRRFEKLGIASTADTRRRYRQMLFTAPGIERFISGVILYDETIRQAADDGTPLPRVLSERGVMPGIKVDRKATWWAGGTNEAGDALPHERLTQGLDGLAARLEEYRELGARFTKWRAVIAIGEGVPSLDCLEANAHMLACYAELAQAAGLVPIVEPEVLMDGDDKDNNQGAYGRHDQHKCEEVTRRTLEIVFRALRGRGVALEGMLLKPNMIVPGKHSGQSVAAAQVAAATVRCLRTAVPPQAPGIVFLSGGQSPDEATATLEAMQGLGAPWPLSFSYGRALQDEAMAAWRGEGANVEAGQAAFLSRAQRVSAACAGV